MALQVLPVMVWANCPPTGQLHSAEVSKVVDGDTLWLVDGRKLRLIGINTPELGFKDRSPEPLAKFSHEALQAILADKRKIYLELGEQKTDKYGRVLAYVYIDKKTSVHALLLEEGLAFPITIPPNTKYTDCFQQLAGKARQSGLGVWGHDYFMPLHVSLLKDKRSSGYRRIIGKVNQVSHGRSGWWIELEGVVSLRLEDKNLPYFMPGQPENLLGRSIEVSGWLVWREKNDKYPPWVMSLQHPHALVIK